MHAESTPLHAAQRLTSKPWVGFARGAAEVDARAKYEEVNH